mmetsp:Transcript_131260/g.339932  ORF Transcript_131260/g.339932 Transcript_131260/m.339932 type:complete len:784 (-) Transcript_131260:435-2786(-)
MATYQAAMSAAGRSGSALPAAQQPQPRQAWTTGPRQRHADFEPLPVRTSIPGLKTVEADLQEQVRHCNSAIQQDLDMLHEQVTQEIYNSVSQELQAVAQRLGSMRGEIGSEIEGLRTAIGHLQQETGWLRSVREQDAQNALESAQKAAGIVSEELAAALTAQETTLRSEAKEIDGALRNDLAEVRAKLEQQGEANEEQAKQHQQVESFWADRVESLEKRIDTMVKELRSDAEKEVAERGRLQTTIEEGRTSAEKSLAQLEEALRGEALVCEARFREAQTAVAALEERQQAALREALDGLTDRSEQVEIRSKYDLDLFKESVSSDFRERLSETEAKLSQLGTECREELNFAHSAWARSIEWNAELDLEKLERDGTCDAESHIFSAAGLRSLRLQLRITRQGSGGGGQMSPSGLLDSENPAKPQRWNCGVFLKAPYGRVSFRVTIAGRTQGFAAEFGEAREWGSQKMVILERVPPKLAVTLEILDVVAPVSGSLPPALQASVQMTDAVQAAARETANLRSTMVRRIEWRVGRISERLAAAREAASKIGDEEALEPLCSPQFAAAGFEGLQLQLYPLGYRPRGEESCGFFLVCPKGLYVKCRAYIGDQVRNFEHQYDVREPYGRGSFCRLADKADADDCVVCGIELLEVRQEQTTQVKGGPFGNIADQLKIVSNPSIGGMEAVRELRELPSGGGSGGSEKKHSRGGRHRHMSTTTSSMMGASFHGAASMRATVPPPSTGGGTGNLQGLNESKSLPSLLPAVSGSLSVTSSFPMSPPPKQMDAMKWR